LGGDVDEAFLRFVARDGSIRGGKGMRTEVRVLLGNCG
jgi:hypothetical protein